MTLRNLLCKLLITQRYQILLNDKIMVKSTTELEQLSENPKLSDSIDRNLDTEILRIYSVGDIINIDVKNWEE